MQNDGLNRRSFLKNSMLAAGVATVGGGLLTKASALSRDQQEGSLTPGDAAILQLLLAAEIIETDLWQQYNELGGVAANNSYVTALQQLDADLAVAQQLHVIVELAGGHRAGTVFLHLRRARGPQAQVKIGGGDGKTVVGRFE